MADGEVSDQISDLELLGAAREGDGPAFGVFYRRRHALLLAFLARRTGSPELTADLLAETFAVALAAVLDRQRELPSEPVGWLLTIARNKLTDGLRRGQVEAAARARLEMEPLELHDRDLVEIERIAEQTDLLAQLAKLLPDDQLQALRARVLEERDYAEIAGELNCSQAVVRKRVSRALRTLRRQLEARI
ncbi:MAG TPA: RNA polymerase sigma factor [Solirubrobacteraceae bacterium]|jgi:RNA polymerase sigma-70 factor (ECF subfamily)